MTLRSWLSGIRSRITLKSRANRRSQQPQRTASAAEVLEIRQVPTTAVLQLGVLTITGSDQADNIAVTKSGSNLRVSGVATTFAASKVTSVVVNAGGGDDTVDLGAVTVSTQVFGGAGNDVLIGGSGKDSLKGETGNDVLRGNGGNDVLDGGADLDSIRESANANFVLTNVLLTGVGTDTLESIETASLQGGAGNNRLDASKFSGSVTLDGAAGNDAIVGGNSNDSLIGGTGNDSLMGNGGNDVLDGGAGNDSLNGGDGDDRFMFSGSGVLGTDTIAVGDNIGTNTLDLSAFAFAITGLNLGVTTAQTVTGTSLKLTLGSNDAIDNVFGTAFNDTITGNALANTLEGRGGNDTLIGNSGDDVLEGGADNDILTGGDGNDRFVFAGSESLGEDVIGVGDNLGTNTLDLSAFAFAIAGLDLGLTTQQLVHATSLKLTLGSNDAIDNVFGSAFNDAIMGNALANTLEGSDGNDTLIGNGGDDVLEGGAGNNVTIHSPVPELAPIADQDITVHPFPELNPIASIRLSAVDPDGDLVFYSARYVTETGEPVDSEMLRVDGNQLSLFYPGDGTFWVEVTASDGRATDTTTFAVHVSTLKPGLPSVSVSNLQVVVRDPGTVSTSPPNLALPAVDFVPVTNRIGSGWINGFDEATVGDFDGDGRDDILFREIDSGENRIAFARGNEDFSIVLNRIPQGWINGYDKVVAGDFNGDGRDDLFFREIDSGANRIVFAAPGHNEEFWVATNLIAPSHVNGYDRMVAGDFDGNGSDDLFFLVRASGANRIAYSVGGLQFSIATERIGASAVNNYDEVVAGDFDGDRRADLFFRQIVSGANRFAFARGDGFTIVSDRLGRGAVNGFDQVVVGDINGDNYDDLFFRVIESGTNRLAIARPGGHEDFYIATQSIASGHINGFDEAFLGDFDGDRRHDLLLREVDSGVNRIGFVRGSAAQFVELDNTMQYRLNPDGRLYRSNSGQGELLADNVRSFEIRNGELWITRTDNQIDVVLLDGDIGDFVARAKNDDANQAGTVNVLPPGSRGVIGNTISPDYLANQLNDAQAPARLLGSVGKILSMDGLGSGTLLHSGGNRYVLTAAHVVENQLGRQLAASALKFQLGSTKYGVRNIVAGRAAFGGRDLAILELDRRIDGVQGAFLSQLSPVEGQQVIVAGYGIDASGRSGNLNFGYARLDDVADQSGGNFDNGLPIVGEHIVNEYHQGEAGIMPGDSGGPDFVAKRIKINDVWVWIPEVVGVHSYIIDSVRDGGRLDLGEATFSVRMTPQVVAIIESVLPKTVQLAATFQIKVLENGDGDSAGQGEWNATLAVNGIGFSVIRGVSDGEWFEVGGKFPILGNTTVGVTFSGREEDDGFFTGGDDVIPKLNQMVTVPATFTGIPKMLGRMHGDVSYELWITFAEVPL